MTTISKHTSANPTLLPYFKKERIIMGDTLRKYIADSPIVEQELSAATRHFFKRIKLMRYRSEQERKTFLLDMAFALEDTRIPLQILRTKLHFFLYWHRHLLSTKKAKLANNIDANLSSARGFYVPLSVFLKQAQVFPKDAQVWDFILHAMGQYRPKLLAKLMKKRGLNDLTERQVRAAEQLNHKQLIVFAHFIRLVQEEEAALIELGFTFIRDSIMEKKGALQLAKLLKTFLTEMFPLLTQKMGLVMPPEKLHYDKTIRKAWFDIWTGYCNPFAINKADQDYQNRFANLAEEVVSFDRFIQYVPAYMWWHLNSRVFPTNLIKHLGAGKNIRQFGHYHLMSNRMAHIFCNLCPTTCPPNRALSYAFVKSLGLNDQLAIALGNYLPQGNLGDWHFKTLKTWKPIILKLVAWQEMEMTEHEWVRLFAYIRHCLDEYPDWSIKGRTFNRLSEQAIAWEAENSRRNSRRHIMYWEGAKQEDWNLFQDGQWYTIVQLKNTCELIHESQQLFHCVQSYDFECESGHCSIWSLRVQEKRDLKKANAKQKRAWFSLATIELSADKEIEQIKAAYNAKPKEKYMAMVEEWAKREGLRIMGW